MEIKEFSRYGRELVVRFKCQRCKAEALRPLKDCLPTECGVRGLYDLKPPADWKDGGFFYPLFCGKCGKQYNKFINGEDLKDGK